MPRLACHLCTLSTPAPRGSRTHSCAHSPPSPCREISCSIACGRGGTSPPDSPWHFSAYSFSSITRSSRSHTVTDILTSLRFKNPFLRILSCTEAWSPCCIAKRAFGASSARHANQNTRETSTLRLQECSPIIACVYLMSSLVLVHVTVHRHIIPISSVARAPTSPRVHMGTRV